ncbi:DNA glycosylase [Trametes polyzona]|nr:DNA glycosylase [Trametes polyzona]
MTEPQQTSKRRKRSRANNLQSRYFPSPKRQKVRQGDGQQVEQASELLARPRWTNKSRFFPAPAVPDLTELLANTAFLRFRDDFLRNMQELYEAKPILIQEHVAASPWKVLVAVTLLNKTAGRKSIPVFFDIMDLWPTPAALAHAPRSVLLELIKDLGLGELRTSRLIHLSQLYLADPPCPDKLRPSRGKLTLPRPGGSGTREIRYPPTPVSHLPGCGPYALDSYRIFCSGADEWKSVRPRDKELIKYLQWKWAIEEYRQWDPLQGPGPLIDLDYIRSMTISLTNNPISH